MKIKNIIISLLLGLLLLTSPILHQNLPTGRVHFSILESIQMDIAEKQFLTLQSIAEIFE